MEKPLMEDNIDYIIVQLVKNCLGTPKSELNALDKKQWQFNCPSLKCRPDIDKYNLEYQSFKHVFKCWKCNYRGYIYQLVTDHGSADDLSRLKLLLPEEKAEKSLREKIVDKPKIDHNLITCKLPEDYRPLGKHRNSPLYKLAWEYLVNVRKVSPALIDKYQIGYTETGNRRMRIIIPSKNAHGKINYYEARSYIEGPKVIPYIKPPSEEVAKSDIIFNEYFINWNLPIFLVEGVFDMLRLPNAIPVLGKEISPLLIDHLLKNNCTIIMCFDPDAMEKTTEIYTLLTSLGLNVFFVDLRSYDKDISKIFEDHGKEEVAKAVKNFKRLDLTLEIDNTLKDEKRGNKRKSS